MDLIILLRKSDGLNSSCFKRVKALSKAIKVTKDYNIALSFVPFIDKEFSSKFRKFTIIRITTYKL